MKKLVYFLLIVTGLASCTTSNTVTRQKNYPKMYEDKPLSILIMPPINKTVDVDAKEYFYTSMAKPLCEKGYYVISPFVAMDFLRSESAYDSELFIDGDLAPFRNILGADAVLFTVINKWDKSTIGGKITVDIEYVLKSTATREVLFERKGELTVDTSVNSGGGGWGALIDLAASALSTALTDKVVAARRCNNYVLRDLPEGRYSPLFEKDQDVEAGGPVFSGVVKY